ncbi:MAG: NifU family protein [Candidatus Buchananbacteria bacterium]|jgi:Fe-S cluster biogenesis protein NfuA
MKDEIKKVLDEIRPSLQADGGDVEFIDFDEKSGVVKLKLQGACSCCPMSQMTLQEGIGRALKSKVKGVKEIESV